ncbi:MAG: hypothetical protein MJ154_00645 [Candidatus Saccharibacteria bacterium]|nr:hypothetical protein [Candidatus Saccharibacteria bacterium]
MATTTFTVDPNGFLVLRTNNQGEKLVSLSELLTITQNLSIGETHYDAIDSKRISIKMVCNFSKETRDLFDESNFDFARKVVKDTIENGSINVPYIIMTKDGHEHIVCKLSFYGDKPYWHVVRSKDFTHRELNYLATTIKHVGIYCLSKKSTP